MSAAMEESVAKDQSSANAKSTSRLLRYPLRSASRSKDEKPPLADSTNSSHSSTKRGRMASSVTKSVGVLDLSSKEKSGKPPTPRRLSVPSKSNASPASKSFGNVTPISEARSKRAAVNQGKTDTPQSDVSKSTNRKKFSILASASYWLNQIKLSETAGKHTISLGFFKLALEAGCEPIQKMSDELKSYVRNRNHDLSGLGDSVKELFEGYKISENYEPSEASVTCSQVPEEPNQLSEDDAHSSSSSITDAEKLKPKSLDVSSDEIKQVKQSNKEVVQKDDSVKRTRRSVSKNPANSKPPSEATRGRSTRRKPSKSMKEESGKEDDKVKKQGKKQPAQGEDTVAEAVNNSPPEEEVIQENKENIAAASQGEDVASAEV